MLLQVDPAFISMVPDVIPCNHSFLHHYKAGLILVCNHNIIYTGNPQLFTSKDSATG